MHFNITALELWFWRISVIVLIIFSLVIWQGVNEAQHMGIENAKMILTNGDQIHQSLQQVDQIDADQAEYGVYFRALIEDYPLKTKLKNRAWCKNNPYCISLTNQK